MNDPAIYLELLRSAHLAAIEDGAEMTGGEVFGLGSRIRDDMQFNTETGFFDIPGEYSVPTESQRFVALADAALAKDEIGLTHADLVGLLVNEFGLSQSELAYAWDIPTYAVMRDGQRQPEFAPEFYTGNPLDPAAITDAMQSSAYRPNNRWAGRQGKDVSGDMTSERVPMSGEGYDPNNPGKRFGRKIVPKHPDAEGPMYEHTNFFLPNSALGWGIEAAAGAVFGPTGMRLARIGGGRLLGMLSRNLENMLPASVLGRFQNASTRITKPDLTLIQGGGQGGPAPTPDPFVRGEPYDWADEIGPPPGTAGGAEFDLPADRIPDAPDADIISFPTDRSGSLVETYGEGQWVTADTGYSRWETADGTYMTQEEFIDKSYTEADLVEEGFVSVLGAQYPAPVTPFTTDAVYGRMTAEEAQAVYDSAKEIMSASLEDIGELQGIGPSDVTIADIREAVDAGVLLEGDAARLLEELIGPAPTIDPAQQGLWDEIEETRKAQEDMFATDDPYTGRDEWIDPTLPGGDMPDPADFASNQEWEIAHREWAERVDAADEIRILGEDGPPGTPPGGGGPTLGEPPRFPGDPRMQPTVHIGGGADGKGPVVRISPNVIYHTGGLHGTTRRIILVDLGDGQLQPFYKRTGRGSEVTAGEVDAIVTGGGGGAGQWVPFDGVGTKAMGPDWYRKGPYDYMDPDDPLFRYGSEELKAVGEMLDENPYLSDLAGDTPGTNSIEIDTRDLMDEDVIAPETLNEILGVHDTAAYDRLVSNIDRDSLVAAVNQSPMRGFGTNWEKYLEPDQRLTDDDFRAGLEGIMGGPSSTSKGYGKAVAEGAATGAVLGSTSAYLFPEEVKKVVGGLAELKDSWWTWIKDFPDHLDWVARATGATLDGMEKATRSTGNQVVDLLNDGFREQSNSLLMGLNGGVIPMMGKADAAILQGASKDLSRQGYDGQAVFSNDIRKEIEAGDAMVVGYRTEKDYERALEQAGQYGLEIDRHYWRKPSRKNIRPGRGEPWTRDHLKKLATTNHFYPDAGLRRGPR